MAKSAENKEIRHINIITERFCSKLGDNAIIVKTRTAIGEKCHCLSSEKCGCEDCEHKKQK